MFRSVPETPRSVTKDWASLSSVTVVVPFRDGGFTALRGQLANAAALRTGLALVCRRDYFPDPTYEALLASSKGSLGPDETKYCEASRRRYEQLATEKVDLAVLCEEPLESLDLSMQNELARLAEPFPACRIVAFGRDQLTVNGGARTLITTLDLTSAKIMLVETDRAIPDEELLERLLNIMSND
jgi:hypothetical protein